MELGGAGCRPHSDKGCAREAEETWRESVAGPWDALRPPRAPLPREGLCTLDMQLRVHSRELLPRCQPVPPGGQSRRASGQGPGGGGHVPLTPAPSPPSYTPGYRSWEFVQRTEREKSQAVSAGLFIVQGEAEIRAGCPPAAFTQPSLTQPPGFMDGHANLAARF